MTLARVLQRKCACGGTPGPSGECDACRKKRSRLQTKLTVNRPGDQFEQEADRMAEFVLGGGGVAPLHTFSNPSLGVQRKMSNESSTTATATAPAIVHDVLAGGGQPLDSATRSFMETRFRHDFSRVRVHTDSKAARSARAVHAAAYTVGNEIVFDTGRYAPASHEGRRLLAHELTHTLQQGSAELRRYTVPANLACDEVVPWLNSNSPYAPEWAETNCTYAFNGGAQVTGSTLPGGSVRADVKGDPTATVTVDCPIDRPEWNPSARKNLAAEVAAWNAMRTSLDGHEAAHKKIGATWQGTLQSRFRAVNFSVTGKDKNEAMEKATAELNKQQTKWQADAQAAQNAIDPFRGAVLACP